MILNDSKYPEKEPTTIQVESKILKSRLGFWKWTFLKMSKTEKSNKVLKKMFKKMNCDGNALIFKKCWK
jgi:hypothetical protein